MSREKNHRTVAVGMDPTRLNSLFCEIAYQQWINSLSSQHRFRSSVISVLLVSISGSVAAHRFPPFSHGFPTVYRRFFTVFHRFYRLFEHTRKQILTRATPREC
jgi:hypothetical protein